MNIYFYLNIYYLVFMFNLFYTLLSSLLAHIFQILVSVDRKLTQDLSMIKEV